MQNNAYSVVSVNANEAGRHRQQYGLQQHSKPFASKPIKKPTNTLIICVRQLNVSKQVLDMEKVPKQNK